MFLHKKLVGKKLSWATLIGIIVIHAGAVAAAYPFFSVAGLFTAAILYVLTGFGVTVGYHRLLTHGSFRTYRIVRWGFAILGELSGQGTVRTWVANHRKHHAHSDTAEDPHSPKDGSWWAHMLWLLPAESRQELQELWSTYVPDLLRERSMRIISVLYPAWHIALGLLLLSIGWLVWDWWTGMSLVLWGIFARTAFLLHVTWAVNSASHMWGYRNYSTRDMSRNNWLVAILALGEGWHNNHHAFPRAANHGHHRWWEIDISYYVILLLKWCRLAWDVKRHSLRPEPT